MNERRYLPNELFGLDIVSGGLDGFCPDAGDFDPGGEWVHRYGAYTLTRGCLRVGTLVLERKLKKPEHPILSLDYEKLMPESIRQVVRAEIMCAADRLATPRKWKCAYESFEADGAPIPGTAWRFEGAVGRRGRVVIRDEGGKRTYPAGERVTTNWSLFDVVQRLPREAFFEPVEFSLIDHFDRVKPNQRLALRGSFTVMLGGKQVRKHEWRDLDKGRIRRTQWAREGDQPVVMHAYDHTAPGLVPWTYWVDGAGRMICAVGGLEAYILETAREEER